MMVVVTVSLPPRNVWSEKESKGKNQNGGTAKQVEEDYLNVPVAEIEESVEKKSRNEEPLSLEQSSQLEGVVPTRLWNLFVPVKFPSPSDKRIVKLINVRITIISGKIESLVRRVLSLDKSSLKGLRK